MQCAVTNNRLSTLRRRRRRRVFSAAHCHRAFQYCLTASAVTALHRRLASIKKRFERMEIGKQLRRHIFKERYFDFYQKYLNLEKILCVQSPSSISSCCNFPSVCLSNTLDSSFQPLLTFDVTPHS